MQPENDNWQQPSAPTTGEPHPYVAPVLPNSAQPEQDMNSVQPDVSQPALREGEDEAVRWQAAEYVQRDKDRIWYVWFAVITIVFILIAIFLIKSLTFAVLIPVMAAALFVVNVMRPPNVYDYTLSRQGLHINDRLYSFADFKEFGLIKDDDQHSILLVPRKRLKPGVTVYFPEEAGEAIVDMLAARLPMHEVTLDPIDRLIRFLRI